LLRVRVIVADGMGAGKRKAPSARGLVAGRDDPRRQRGVVGTTTSFVAKFRFMCSNGNALAMPLEAKRRGSNSALATPNDRRLP
jgi:hypothetical protein